MIQYNQSGQQATPLEQFLNPVGEEIDEPSNGAPWFSSETETVELDESYTIILTGQLSSSGHYLKFRAAYSLRPSKQALK